MNAGWAILASVGLLVGNAFFVAAEFALVASRRHRLERAAADGSRAARAAVAGVRELSLMLAGAQLGITLCTLGLGALAKPAVTEALDPLFVAVGLPTQLSYAVSFAISLVVVVFLHMVVGEMAPKSWAISDPERSALLLAVPFRAFARGVRWLLSALNATSNALLRLFKVEPQDELAHAHGPDELRMLVRQSAERGLIPEGQQRLLTRMLQLQNTTVAQVMVPRDAVVTTTEDATALEVEQLSRDTGRSRFPVVDRHGRFTGIVHIREVVRATASGADPAVRDLMTPPLVLPEHQPVATAVTTMRGHRAQLALVAGATGEMVGTGEIGANGQIGANGEIVGIAALEDLLEELIGDFYDETDS